MKKIIFRWLKAIVLIYCTLGICIYYLQEKILFHPKEVKPDYNYNFPYIYKEVNLPVTIHVTMNIIQFVPKDTPVKGVVLYFHGNRDNVSWYAHFAPNFTKNNYEVWMIDYPGFGKSTGEFSEDQLYKWSLIFYKLARARFAKDSIIIYGKSMGTGIAAQLASVRDCKKLILETPYYNLPSVMGTHFPIYPVQTMIRFKIPTYKYLPNVTAPVTIFHGNNDWIIPHSNSNRLRPFLKPNDEFITIEGGSHNDLATFPLYQQKLDSLLK
jgi:uncharacterized protein